MALLIPLFSLREKRVCARKHHRFRCTLSHKYGFVCLWLLFPDSCFVPKSVSPMLLCIIAWKVDRKAALHEPVLLALKIYSSSIWADACVCIFFLTRAYFACKRNSNGLSPAAVPSLYLPLFLPGEGSFVRKRCIKHAPAVFAPSLSLSKLNQKLSEERSCR